MQLGGKEGTGATNDRRLSRTAHVGLLLAALTLSSVGMTASGAAGASSSSKVVVSTMAIGKTGKVLVSDRMALYTLTPSTTTCDAQCLKIWPAVTLPAHVRSATPGSGVSRSALGVTIGFGGIRQVTYHDRPLYWYSGDTLGHLNGDLTDQWGKWTAVVVSRQGSQSSSGPASGDSTAGSGGASF